MNIEFENYPGSPWYRVRYPVSGSSTILEADLLLVVT